MLGDNSEQFRDLLPIPSVLLPFAFTGAKVPSCSLSPLAAYYLLFTPIRPATTCWSPPDSFLPAGTCLPGPPYTTYHTLSEKDVGTAPSAKASSPKTWAQPFSQVEDKDHIIVGKMQRVQPHLCVGERVKV